MLFLRRKPFLLLIVLILSISEILAQNSEILPTVLIIPKTDGNESIQSKLDSNSSLNVGLASLKNEFNEYGYITKDFQDILNTKNPKAFISKQSVSDIVVELDIVFDKHSSGNSARITLEAIEVVTNNAISSITCQSNKFYTEDISLLTLNALNQKNSSNFSCFDNFMKAILMSWNTQYEKGKNAKIIFSIDPNSKLTMSSKINSKNDERLTFIIEDWLKETAFDNYVKISLTTDRNINVDEYKYPYNQTVRQIERNLYTLFDSLKIDVKIESRSNFISITIL